MENFALSKLDQGRLNLKFSDDVLITIMERQASKVLREVNLEGSIGIFKTAGAGKRITTKRGKKEVSFFVSPMEMYQSLVTLHRDNTIGHIDINKLYRFAFFGNSAVLNERAEGFMCLITKPAIQLGGYDYEVKLLDTHMPSQFGVSTIIDHEFMPRFNDAMDRVLEHRGLDFAGNRVINAAYRVSGNKHNLYLRFADRANVVADDLHEILEESFCLAYPGGNRDSFSIEIMPDTFVTSGPDLLVSWIITDISSDAKTVTTDVVSTAATSNIRSGLTFNTAPWSRSYSVDANAYAEATGDYMSFQKWQRLRRVYDSLKSEKLEFVDWCVKAHSAN